MELMASLIHSPEIIFLDEPTIGLDLVSQDNIRSFLKDYHKKNNCTIVITSHYMADVQALCSRLVLIFDGDKTYDGSLLNFEKIFGNEKNVTFNFSQSQNPELDFWKKYEGQWNQSLTQVDLKIPEEKLREVGFMIFKDYPVTEFNTEKMPIERVMKTLMKNPEIVKQMNGRH
jgi:ABC-2 type transport system ATP-binding protein